MKMYNVSKFMIVFFAFTVKAGEALLTAQKEFLERDKTHLILLKKANEKFLNESKGFTIEMLIKENKKETLSTMLENDICIQKYNTTLEKLRLESNESALIKMASISKSKLEKFKQSSKITSAQKEDRDWAYKTIEKIQNMPQEELNEREKESDEKIKKYDEAVSEYIERLKINIEKYKELEAFINEQLKI